MSIKDKFLKYKADLLQIYFKANGIPHARWNDTEVIYGKRYIEVEKSISSLETQVSDLTDKTEKLEPLIDLMLKRIEE